MWIHSFSALFVKQVSSSHCVVLYLHPRSFCCTCKVCSLTSQVAPVIKNLSASARDMRHRLILGSGRSPGGGHDNSLQYSFLENHMNRIQSIGSQRVRHDWRDLACKHAWLSSQVLYSVPLFYVSLFMPILYCFQYSAFPRFRVRK